AAYGRYLIEPAARRPLSFTSPSVFTLYRAELDLRGYLAVGISQSGRTPEIVATLSELRRTGASAVAITNDPESELAAGADADLVELLRGRGVPVLTMSPSAASDLPLPGGLPESLAPVVAVVRAQQLAHAMALRLGLDPDQPQGLSKVTMT